jgi:hypothetical protein
MFILDLGSLIRFLSSRFPDPVSKAFPDPESASASKNLSILTQKVVFKLSEYDPGCSCSSRILILIFTHPGSRIQGSKRRRIQDPGSGSATLLDSLHYLSVLLRCYSVLVGMRISTSVFCENLSLLMKKNREARLPDEGRRSSELSCDQRERPKPGQRAT